MDTCKKSTDSLTRITIFFFCFFFFCFRLSSHGGCLAAAPKNLTTGSSLSLNQTIQSPSGLFQFGFFEMPQGSSSMYLGVFYNQNTVKDLVSIWIANRNQSVSTDATCTFTAEGNLTLKDGEGGSILWQIGPGDLLELLDSGNLVLKRNSNASSETTMVWQSFGDPGNTWMPTGSIGPGQKLESWRNASDPRPGPYSLRMGNNSNFVLWYNDSIQYWDSGAWNGAIFSNVPEMTANYIFNFSFSNITGFTWSVYPEYGEKYNNSRFVMQEDGLIAESSYGSSQNSWDIFWTKPNQHCDVIRYCGQNSICNNNVDPHCSCPAGFKSVDPTEWGNQIFQKGCERASPLDCPSNQTTTTTTTTSSDGFLVLNKTTFSGWTPTFSQVVDDEGTCRTRCLSDCSCEGFYFLQAAGGSARGNCSLFGGSIYDGTVDSTSQGSYSIRLSAESLNSQAPASESKGKSSTGLIAAIAVGGAALIGVLCVAMAVLILERRRRRRRQSEAKRPEAGLRAFSYAELHAATKGFKEKLGSGGFGVVFRGVVGAGGDEKKEGEEEEEVGEEQEQGKRRIRASSSGPSLHVAVKVLHRLDEGEKQFRAEVRTIGTIQHVNLVRLLGFCSEGKHRLLVYEMAENGSLDHLLFGKAASTVLPWARRFQVALGAARGVAYLHESCRECIIHCDLKPENILLDAAFVVKVADFGLAKLVGREFSHVLTTLRGTRGYLAPEWIAGMPITSKADVYSFGMTLLEIISGQRNIRDNVQSYSSFFPLAAAKLVHQPDADLASLVDPRLEGNFDMEQLERMLYCAIWCIQDNEDARLSMGKVVQILEGSISVDIPPIPTSLQCLLESDSFVKQTPYVSTSYEDSSSYPT